jgi:CRISPR/Cas system-associated exonuclease Cas4 (RecB family)
MPTTTRSLSYSEIQTAMSCWARWDFQYGGRLAGSTLKPRETERRLSDGRAWGAALAAYHANAHQLFPLMEARAALTRQINEDAEAQMDAGIPVDLVQLVEMELRLGAMLDHYVATAPPMPGTLTRVEDALDVPLPSRGAGRSSSRYRFLGYIDGYLEGPWIVEYKLRDSLQPLWLIELSQQTRWYAWALQRLQGGSGPVGVIVDERLNEAPKPAAITPKTRKVSHTAHQLTTPESYLAACEEMGEDPHDDVVRDLHSRVWQQRHQIPFRPGELEEAGEALVSAAKLIRDLDSGEFQPVRNAVPMLCRSCRYRRICANPHDELFVESLYERTVPKRLRTPDPMAA